MADVTVYFQGWNSVSQSWGGGPWGQNVALPGSIGSVGTVSIIAEANALVTGLAATGSVGAVTVTADANVSVSTVGVEDAPTATEPADSSLATQIGVLV